MPIMTRRVPFSPSCRQGHRNETGLIYVSATVVDFDPPSYSITKATSQPPFISTHSDRPMDLLGSEPVATVWTDGQDIHNYSRYSGQSAGAPEEAVQVEAEEERILEGRRSVIETLLGREGFRRYCASLTGRKTSALEEVT